MLMFDPGVMMLPVPIDILVDDIVEDDESFSLQLTIPANVPRSYTTGDPNMVIITIVNNDSEFYVQGLFTCQGGSANWK